MRGEWEAKADSMGPMGYWRLFTFPEAGACKDLGFCSILIFLWEVGVGRGESHLII